MSILIKGLGMPADGELLCINIYPDGKVCINLDLNCERIATAVPAADVVPVVRCGECAYHEIADYGGGYSKNVCRLLDRQIQDDDYCSYALRKDGDGE